MNGSQSLEEGVDIVSGVKLSAEELTDWAKQNSNKDLKAISLCGFLDWYQNKALRDNRPWQMPLSDRDNVLKAFEWLKIVDRYFVPSRTLARFADLIQKFSSEEKRPLSDRIKGFFFNSSQD